MRSLQFYGLALAGALFSKGFYDLLWKGSRCERCEMPIMWPSYRPISSPSYPYRALNYGSIDYDNCDNIVVFLHGNSGDYKQVRTLGSWLQEGDEPQKVRVVTVDFYEEFVAMSSVLVRRQAAFVRELLMQLRGNGKKIVIVAHSMGSFAAKLNADLVEHIISLAVPTESVMFPMDADLQRILQIKSKKETLVESGWNDFMAPQALKASSLPYCWSDADHQAVVWSHCIVRVVARMLRNLFKGMPIGLPALEAKSIPDLDSECEPVSVFRFDDHAGQCKVFNGIVMTSLKYGRDFSLHQSRSMRVIPGPSIPFTVLAHQSAHTPLYTLIDCEDGCDFHLHGSTEGQPFDSMYLAENAMRDMVDNPEQLVDVIRHRRFVKQVQRVSLAAQSWLFKLNTPVVFSISTASAAAIVECDGAFPETRRVITSSPAIVYVYDGEDATISVDYLATLVRFVLIQRRRLLFLVACAGMAPNMFALLLAYTAQWFGAPSAIAMGTLACAAAAVIPWRWFVFALSYALPVLIAVVNAKRRHDFTKKWEIVFDQKLLMEVVVLGAIAYCRRNKPAMHASCVLPFFLSMYFFDDLWILRLALILSTVL